ncbi:MAG: cellulase family glycosylhydrolase [Hyphomicrobiales bacterium]|nr:cellulase family glycosylhydrolase [Hyphomicrobiales bacterium]MBV8664425.1 cellulase family glycosylhydrolase [Hyphomicrobiales bacterium]
MSPPFSRRDLLIAAAGAGLTPGGPIGARAADQPLRFAQRGPIKGIGVVAPIADWAAPFRGLTPRRTAALREAGFNTLRVFISLKAFMAAEDAGSGIDAAKVTARWIDYVRHGVDAGFRVLVSWESTFEERLALLDGGEATARFRRALAAVSRGLAEAFDPAAAALEVMNEPPEETRLAGLGLQSWTSTFAPLFVADIRNAAPLLTVVVQSETGGWSETIASFDPAAFDNNTMFCFHFYKPGEFTHQGVKYPDFYGVPFPVERYAGGKEAMQHAILARVAADPGIGEAQKKALSAQYRGVIDYLWWPDSPLGPKWVSWPKLDAWIAERRIDPRRILCGEFGVVSNLNFNGSPGTDLASRANYMRAVRQAVESRGFGGWIAHQSFGDFNLFEQASISQCGDALIAELVDALFR